jgi:GntR family transcriptional regulator
MIPIDTLAASDPGLLYRRVAMLLRSEIGRGDLAAGSRLPSIAALAARYGVAPATVRQALRLLNEEGLTRSRQGSGTFVAEGAAAGRPELSLDLGWPALAQPIRGNTAEVLDEDEGAPSIDPVRDGGHLAASYWRMRRVHRGADGRAYALVEMHIDRRWFDRAPQDFRTGMALPLLERLGGPDLPEMRQSFRLVAAGAATAAALGIPLGSPVGQIFRTLFDRDRFVAYWSRGEFRGDAVVFEATLRRAS